jgi:hypothetical protein
VQLYRLGSTKPALINGIFGFTCIIFSVHYLLKGDVPQFSALLLLSFAFFALALRISSRE